MNSVAEKTGDVVEEHASDFLDGLEAGGVGGPMPLIKEAARAHAGFEGPEVLEVFPRTPRLRNLEVFGSEFFEMDERVRKFVCGSSK